MLKRAAEVTTICLKEIQMDVYVKQSHANRSGEEIAPGRSSVLDESAVVPFRPRASFVLHAKQEELLRTMLCNPVPHQRNVIAGWLCNKQANKQTFFFFFLDLEMLGSTEMWSLAFRCILIYCK